MQILHGACMQSHAQSHMDALNVAIVYENGSEAFDYEYTTLSAIPRQIVNWSHLLHTYDQYLTSKISSYVDTRQFHAIRIFLIRSVVFVNILKLILIILFYIK